MEKYAKLLYGQALLLADLPLEDPAEYAQLVCSPDGIRKSLKCTEWPAHC